MKRLAMPLALFLMAALPGLRPTARDIRFRVQVAEPPIASARTRWRVLRRS